MNPKYICRSIKNSQFPAPPPLFFLAYQPPNTGDIRPLVENGEELSQVAQGLLDTVVGRLDDNAQRMLLAKRGKELDAVIVERA